MGLTYDETLDMPIGQLMDLIAIEQVKNEGFTFKDVDSDVPYDEQVIPDIL